LTLSTTSAPAAGDKSSGSSEKSKDVSTLVLEEIKKIQKKTEGHKLSKGGGDTFR
jgi:hypothetical protein